MTPSKIVEVLEGYRAKMLEIQAEEKQLRDYNSIEISRDEQLSHINYMIGAAINFVQAGRIDKSFRWLGFIQGVLWANGIFTLDDLKEHSRPR